MDVMEVPLQITIKIPFSAEGNENFSTNVFVSWTVRQLKNHLEQSLPDRPSVSAQKLILSGRVLSDELTLKECFKVVQKGCFPILHLVCSRPAVDAPNAHLPEGLRQRNITESEVSATPVTEIPPITMSSPVFDQQTMMFQMYQNYLYMMGMNGFPPAAMPFTSVPGMPFQPAFHQMYNPATPFTPLEPPPQPVHRHPVIAIMRGHHIANLPGALPANPHQPVNIQLQENDQGNRDFLDWAYISMRLVLFLCIIYLYSSTSRFFSAFTMLALFLLFNTIRDFRRWRERHARRQEAAQVPPPPADGVDAPVDDTTPQADGVVLPMEQQQPGLISTVVSIVTGFVTSLVPENIIHAVGN